VGVRLQGRVPAMEWERERQSVEVLMNMAAPEVSGRKLMPADSIQKLFSFQKPHNYNRSKYETPFMLTIIIVAHNKSFQRCFN
jgi:hypothetical protein